MRLWHEKKYFSSYILAPTYIVLSALIFIAFSVLMCIDDEKYFVAGLLCLGFFVVLTAAVLLLVSFIRKEAIQTKLRSYDFETNNIAALELYNFSTDKILLKFDKNGMYINNKLFL